MSRVRTIHHGIDPALYRLQTRKQDYVSFIGRLAPVKGPHLAIEAAQKAGIPLKIAGEIQPIFRDYFEAAIKPHLDGHFVEYVGEADLEAKNELLGNSLAMLFPIQWDEPFGLVMIEAMMCGTPVLALPGGSVPEIVRDGVCGFVCQSVDEMAGCVRRLRAEAAPERVRAYAERNFSIERMVADYAALYQELVTAQVAVGDEDLPEEHRAIA